MRKHTQESIFNSVRGALEADALLKAPVAQWADFEWRVGDFVDFRAERIGVPLISVLARLRVIAESFAFLTSELSTDSLETRIPQILRQLRAGASDGAEDASLDTVLSALREAGEIAHALSGVVNRLETEAEESGLVDIVMFEKERAVSSVIAVASLDRDYVDTRLLRRLGQSNFGVLGKVIRVPEIGTAFNAFRNSMLGATNQFPVLLSRLTERLFELPLLLGDSVYIGDEDDRILLDFVGSASAITEMMPLWASPSVELFPIAIYA